MPTRAFGRDPFTSEFLGQINTRFMVSVANRLPDGRVLLTRIHREKGLHDFTRREVKWIGAISDDLARAAGPFVLEATLRSSGIEMVGTVRFGCAGQILSADLSAMAVLKCSSPNPYLALSTAVSQLLREEPADDSRSVPLILDDGDCLSADVIRVDPRSGTAAIAVLKRVGGVRPIVSANLERARLTSREREVALLTIKGLANHRIAILLSLGQDAVKWHLKNIFRKVGVTTRTELAAQLFESAGARIR